MKIAVVGCGHMGGFLARRLTETHQVAVMDTEPARMNGVSGAVQLADVHALAAFKPDMLLNAVPLKDTVPVFENLLAHLPDDCILADVTSVKSQLPAFYRESGLRFVSTHPMFGPTFAELEQVAGEGAVIIDESDREGVCVFEALFEKLGLQQFSYSFEEHDQLMAYSLSMPFVSTMVFAAVLDRKTVPGTTFKRHRETAEGLLAEDDDLLAEILFNPHSMRQLERVTQRLEFMKHVIAGRDRDEAVKFFGRLRENLQNGTT